MAITVVLQQVGSVLKGAVDELFPPSVLPVVDGQAWEADQTSEYCPRCGITVDQGAVTKKGCWNCIGKRLPWNSITRLHSYSQPVDEWVKQMKYQRQWRWGRWFGKVLGERIHLQMNRAPNPQPSDPLVIVCPVPMHWIRSFRRGYNQAEIIARALAKSNGWQMRRLLARTRYTKPQTSIPPSYRQRNVSKAFAVRDPFLPVTFFRRLDLSKCTVVLVDDVKTSGATLRACARQLKHAGVKNVEIAVASVADPPQLRQGRN